MYDTSSRMQHDVSDVSDAFPASYAAFFAPRTHNFETVDFRVPATPHNLRTYFPTNNRQQRLNARFTFLLGIGIGVTFAFIGFAVDQLTRGLTIALYRLAARIFVVASFWSAVPAFVALSLLYVSVPALLVVYYAPLGAGSGIPELKAYLNGVRIPSFLALNSLIVKAVGIAFSISSGLICGKQGPMIHAGAIVGAGLSQAASTTFRWRLRWSQFNFLRTEQWKRDYTAVGAAVGVAVAFGSPMGAWMWVYEEACTHWSWHLGLITLSGCLSGAVVVRILNFLVAGVPNGGFGAFTLTQFGKLVTPFSGTDFPLKDVPGFFVLGMLGGVAGAVLPIVNKWITLFRYKYITQPRPRIFETLVIALLTAFLRILVPYIARDCRPVEENFVSVLSGAPLQDFSRFNCPDGEFSPWAASIYNPTDTVVRGLLFSSNTSAFISAPVAVALVYYFVFIVWTYGIAVPAGIFFPGFLLGSVYGRLVGNAVQAIFPARTDVSVTGYAFLGAVSALAGITRTISVAVIALEATGGYNASFASVAVALTAKLFGDFLYARGIYDLHIDLKGIPFLKNELPRLDIYMRTRMLDVMQSSIIGVRRLSRVSGLVNMLQTNDHHAFPVFLKVTPNSSRDSRSLASLAQDDTPLDSRIRRKSSTGPGRKDVDSPVEKDSTTLSMQEGSIHLSLDSLGKRELELEEERGPLSSIITPARSGMEATIFDEGKKRLVWLINGVVKSFDSDVADERGSMTPSSAPGTKEPHTSIDDLDYQLIGMIDRTAVLALLKHELERKEPPNDTDVEADIGRDELDAAWPNPGRLKGGAENELLKQVQGSVPLERILDMKDFIDPSPLLLSARTPVMAAYELLRRTGARQVLVVNMRSGRICGIVTRKDVLLNSVEEAHTKNVAGSIENKTS